MSSTATEIAMCAGPTIYDAAVDLVKRERNAGIAFVQRKLGIGYTLAAEILERMEKEGIVSPVRKGGTREVLV